MKHVSTVLKTEEVEITDSIECDICHTNYDDVMEI